jgi:predicted small secreted protein
MIQFGSPEETNMNKTLAKIFLTLVILTGASAVLSACNTTEGVGKDMSAAGHKISNEAEEHK